MTAFSPTLIYSHLLRYYAVIRLLVSRDCLMEGGWAGEALALYIVELMVMACDCVSREVVRKVEEYAAGGWDELFEEFTAVLHGDVERRNVDNVVREYEDLRNVMERDNRGKQFWEELRWFVGKYQNGEIEFKR